MMPRRRKMKDAGQETNVPVVRPSSRRASIVFTQRISNGTPRATPLFRPWIVITQIP
jgi:hypothetical protein